MSESAGEGRIVMILIEKGYVIDPKSGREGNLDILTKDSKILRMGTDLRRTLSDQELANCTLINGEGLLIAPGLVDIHVHFRDPGYPEKEDILSGAAAAEAGGYTTVVMMANTKPTADNVSTLTQMLLAAEQAPIHVKTCAALSVGLQGKALAPMKELADAGAIGFTDDGICIMDQKLLLTAMQQAKALDLPISLHEEDPALIQENGIHHGKASEYFGIYGAPREAEYAMIARDLDLAEKTGASVSIQHISTKEGVELLRQARRKGSSVHGEATPHHFTLTQEDAIRFGTLAKVNPPLREEEDRQAIIEGLVDGTIEFIATDHAPHTRGEKELPLTKAPSGMIGLETALSLGLTKLVNGGYLTVKQLLTKMSTNPAAFYHLDAGYLAEGGPADIILIDTTLSYEPEIFHSKSINTPFLGQTLTGKVMTTICQGKIVYQA
jgi:dihydroorotase